LSVAHSETGGACSRCLVGTEDWGKPSLEGVVISPGIAKHFERSEKNPWANKGVRNFFDSRIFLPNSYTDCHPSPESIPSGVQRNRGAQGRLHLQSPRNDSLRKESLGLITDQYSVFGPPSSVGSGATQSVLRRERSDPPLPSLHDSIWVLKMNTLSKQLLVVLVLGLILLGMPAHIYAANPSILLAQESGHNPEDLINAVNNLRLENGLPTLAAHPALMRVAQWEADAILAGAPGHTRPPGLTLGQQMITYGYPLAGNIALDGLRSENWVGGQGMTVDQAIISWLGDAPHTNTMLSSSRSDIGAGVAVGQYEDGSLRYIYVIETALQTSDGQQQYEALVFLTALPETQIATYGDATQAAAVLTIPQYMIPVSVATARPDGDVIHKVQYGQTLWSIAIEYGVKIEDIRRLNNFTDDEVFPNQNLLVQKAATQPVPKDTAIASPTPGETAAPPSPTPSLTPTPKSEAVVVESRSTSNSTLTMFILLLILVPGGLIWLYLKESRPPTQ